MNADWLVAIGGLISAIVGSWALVLSVRIYLESKRPPVEWRRFNDKPDGHYRLLNVSGGTAAYNIEISEIDRGNAFVNYLTGTDTVLPGGWIPIAIERSMTDPFPTVVELRWREGPVHGTPRKRVYSTVLNF
jgi:hypothetical protein